MAATQGDSFNVRQNEKKNIFSETLNLLKPIMESSRLKCYFSCRSKIKDIASQQGKYWKNIFQLFSYKPVNHFIANLGELYLGWSFINRVTFESIVNPRLIETMNYSEPNT